MHQIQAGEHLEAADEVLIERARMGDSGALDELLSRHRSRAFSWAKRIVEDNDLAEDVVQEALIQAFLKLGSLFDISKFLPWLQKIVRHQAMMKLRRGGLYNKETPFASLNKTVLTDNANWRDLDTVLYHLSLRSQKTNPKDHLVDQLIETQLPAFISDLIRVLGAREKQVFEQYFYEQLSPSEIADYFHTPVNNIHKSLSRIRRKLSLHLHDTQLLEQISDYLTPQGHRVKMLAKPEMESKILLHPDLSFPISLFQALKSTGRTLTLAEVMGFSGYAFILNVDTTRIDVSSTVNWDWDTFLTNGLLTLGFHSKYFDYQHYKQAASSKHKTKKLLYALQVIRDSIDKGIPAALMGAMHYEAALIYGYNDQTQTLFMTDSKSTKEIPYNQLYYNSYSNETRESNSLYGYVFDREIESFDSVLQMTRLIERIISYSEGRDYTFMPYVNGTAAYDVWIKAFERKTVDPLGNASCLLVYGWLREQAAQFWREQYIKWETHEERFNLGPLLVLIKSAEHSYGLVAEAYLELRRLFPFPSGGDPHQAKFATEAVYLLQSAKKAETEAIENLKQLWAELKKENPQDIIHIPIHPFYSFGGIREKLKHKEQSADYVLSSSIIMCRNLKHSIQFYSKLTGMQLPSALMAGTVGFFPMSGLDIMLMDLRLDLMHVNWQPSLYIQAGDIELAFAEAKRLQWEIIYPLDRGGTQTDFFVIADSDNHQIIIGSHLLYPSFSFPQITDHPIRLKMEQICLAVKDEPSSQQNYNRLFGTRITAQTLQFVNKFHKESMASRIQLTTPDLTWAYRSLRESNIPILRYPGELGDATWGMIIQDPDGLPIIIRQS